MPEFAVHGIMTAKPGRRTELVDLMRATITALGDAPGLLDYTINTALDDPDTLWITQRWTSKTAHDTVTKTAANKAETARIMDLLAKPPLSAYGDVVEHGGS
jgi:quinol monooxygenase YgiN